MGSMKYSREILYLTGDSAEKRRLLRSGGTNVARAMNDEVSVVCRVKGKDYYVVGKHPFAAFSVYKYLRYERALLSPSPLTKKQARSLLKRVGLRVGLRRKLGGLCFVKRRLVQLAARLTDKTAILAINLDGAPYSEKLRRRLRRAVRRLSRAFGLWIAVTDSRLVPRRGRAVEVKPKSVYARPDRVFRSKPTARRTLLARFAAEHADPPAVEGSKIVCVSPLSVD